ncbi:MAG: hypothetical protein JRN15_09700 [Nitrososphaerota archaeon]|nr:hypothetical protein [Nitrososphaerota archaeon]
MEVRFEQSLQRRKFGYDIMWFVWNRDGIFRRQDWEPLVFFWHELELVQVTARPHFRWESYYAQGYGEPIFAYAPLRVAFTTTFHAAVIETIDPDNRFKETISGYSKLKVQPTSILTDKVPPSARKAWSKREGINISSGQEIHDKAIECLEELNKRVT